MNAPITRPAFAEHIDEGIANSVRAHKHLAQMDPARRAQLEREWLAAEAIDDRALIEADRLAIVERVCGRGADVVGIDRSVVEAR